MGTRLTVLVFMVAGGASVAQEAPSFKTGAALVRVDVQVTEGRRPVAGLGVADFVVTDEGEVKVPVAFGREEEPLELMLLLDVSGSMSRMLREMAAAGREALRQLKAGDKVGVYVFARRAREELELSGEFGLAERALRAAALEGGLGAGTVVNEALLEVAGAWKRRPEFQGRRAAIVLTDNGGVHYKQPDEQVVRAFGEVNAVLNAIVPGGAKRPERAVGPDVNPDFTPADVFGIAEATGGEVLRSGDAGERFRELLERLRARYLLTVKASGQQGGGYRRLRVELSEEARRRHPKAEIRARAGYFAAGEQEGGGGAAEEREPQ